MKRLSLTPQLIVCIMGFSYLASSSVIAPILSVYLKDGLNATIEMIGLVTASFFVVAALARFPLGVLTGGKKTLNLLLPAFVVLSICPVLYPLTESLFALAVLRAAQGLAYAFVGTTSLVLAALTISSVKMEKGVGLFTASLSLGLLVGPTLTSLSIPVFGVSNTFYLAGLMGSIGVFAAFFLNFKISAIEKDWQIIGVILDRETFKNKISALAHNRMFRISFVATFAFFILFGAILVYAPLYVKEVFDFGDDHVSLLFVLYYVTTTGTRLSVGRVVKRVSKPKLIIIGMVLASLFSSLLALFTSSLLFVSLLALIGATQGVIFPVGSLLIAEHVQPSRNVLANSLYMMAIDVGQGVAPLVTASAVGHYGLGYSFVVSAAIVTAATFTLVFLMHLDRSERSG